MDLMDQIHEVAHSYPGGVEALAARMDRKPDTLRKKVLPTNDTHDLTVKELRTIVDYVDTDKIAIAFANERGLMCIVAALFSTHALSVSTSNSVISLGINQQGSNGGAIDSLKVLGVETVDVQDLGRLIQASVFIDKPLLDLNNRTMCNGQLAPEWFNPTEGGDICGVRSIVQATSTPNPGEINVITKVQSWHGEHLWDENNPSSWFLPDHFIIEGHHKLGPLPYTNAQEAIRYYTS